MARCGATKRIRETQRLKRRTQHCLLAMIAERHRYGFELIRALGEPGLDTVSEGSIYLLLRRTGGEGYVELGCITSAKINRPRRYYRITVEGEKILSEWNRG